MRLVKRWKHLSRTAKVFLKKNSMKSSMPLKQKLRRNSEGIVTEKVLTAKFEEFSRELAKDLEKFKPQSEKEDEFVSKETFEKFSLHFKKAIRKLPLKQQQHFHPQMQVMQQHLYLVELVRYSVQHRVRQMLYYQHYLKDVHQHGLLSG